MANQMRSTQNYDDDLYGDPRYDRPPGIRINTWQGEIGT